MNKEPYNEGSNTVEENQMFEIIDDHSAQAIIKVVGVGGGGGNAINYMVEEGLTGAEFIAMNTDAQALRKSKAEVRIQLGASITNGLGAGANPEIGYKSAIEDKESIKEAITGADVVFIAVGMGGGTGTGAASVVAEVAKGEGALTIGVISKPFAFEGKKRANYALQGIEKLSEHIDSLLVIPNDKLQKSLPKGVTFLDAFNASNGVLFDAVSGFSAIINDDEGMINIDFADVRTVMTEAGTNAVMGIGIASGDDRAERAVEQAIACPLLEDVDLSGARGVLVHVVGGLDFTLEEFYTIGDALKPFASEDAHHINGMTFDPEITDGAVHVTVIVTGIGDRGTEIEQVKAKPAKAADQNTFAAKEVAKPEEKKEEVVKSGASYLDIPAFLREREQAD